MGFFGIGTGEILLVLVLALIIWGPGRLPEIARTMGKTVRALRKATFDLTTAVTKEIEGTENSHQPPQLKETSRVKTEESSSDARKRSTQPRHDPPKNVEEQRQENE